jgi:dolichol-phosphate mannosyltransferase
MKKTVCIIIPVYNEENNLVALTDAIAHVFKDLPYTYQILFVDDGSRDHSMDVVRILSRQNKVVRYISFSRNFGKDNALKAGFDACNTDIAITMDADLQHPPELIPQMLQLWEEGFHVVYAYREEKNRNVGTISHLSSYLFYKVMNNLSELKLEQGIADFRLIDRKVVNAVKELNEIDIFLRGLIKWFGFKQTGIAYQPPKRFSGKTTYSNKRLIKLALVGITSFSTKPLYAAAYLGFLISLSSVLYFPYALISYYSGNARAGWVSVIMTIAFFGGLQLCILGIIGLYLGKVFMQTKQRPHYLIQETNLYDTDHITQL